MWQNQGQGGGLQAPEFTPLLTCSWPLLCSGSLSVGGHQVSQERHLRSQNEGCCAGLSQRTGRPGWGPMGRRLRSLQACSPAKCMRRRLSGTLGQMGVYFRAGAHTGQISGHQLIMIFLNSRSSQYLGPSKPALRDPHQSRSHSPRPQTTAFSSASPGPVESLLSPCPGSQVLLPPGSCPDRIWPVVLGPTCLPQPHSLGRGLAGALRQASGVTFSSSCSGRLLPHS